MPRNSSLRSGTRSLILLLGAAWLAGCTAPDGGSLTSWSSFDPPPPHPLRVMTWNIRHGRGADGLIDLERIAAVIRSAAPDLVALQEVDDATGRSGGIDQAAALGDLTGLHHAYGAAMPYDGGRYGVAILSRFPLDATVTHPLPATLDREPRTALEVRVTPALDASVPPITFIATHLDHADDSTDRLLQASTIRARFDADPTALQVIAGDCNDDPASATLDLLTARWPDTAGPNAPATWPADAPNQRIDYVLAGPADRWSVASHRTLNETIASDHRPVVVDLLLPLPRPPLPARLARPRPESR